MRMVNRQQIHARFLYLQKCSDLLACLHPKAHRALQNVLDLEHNPGASTRPRYQPTRFFWNPLEDVLAHLQPIRSPQDESRF